MRNPGGRERWLEVMLFQKLFEECSPESHHSIPEIMNDARQERGGSRLGGDHRRIFRAEAHRKRGGQVDVQWFHARL